MLGVAKALGASTFLMLLGSGSYALSQWVLVVVYARSLGADAVGLFALSIAIASPIMALTQLGYRQIIIADLLRTYSFYTYYRSRIGLTIVGLLASIPIFLMLGYREESFFALLFFTLGRAIDSVADIHHALLHVKNRLGFGASITSIRSVLGIALAGGAVFTSGSIVLSAAGFAAAAGLSLLWLHLSIGRREKGAAADASQQLKLMRLALPAGVSGTVISLTAYVPRFVLESVGGVTLVGQAAVLEYLLAIGMLGVVSFGHVMSKPLATAYREGRRKSFILNLSFAAGAVATLAAFAAALAYAFGAEAVIWVYGPNYSVAAASAGSVMLGGGITYVGLILWFALMATNQFSGIVVNGALVLVVTLAGSWWTISNYGLAGFGFALAISGLANILVWSAALRKQLAKLLA